jgi:hypothetical protein
MTERDGDNRTGQERLPSLASAAVSHRAALAEEAIDLLAGVLADAGRAFGGDMRAAALFILLAQASQRPAKRGASHPADAPRGLSQSELAAISGISRETVRRKLAAMEKLGCVKRSDAGWFLDWDTVDAVSAQSYVALRARLLERAQRLFDAEREDRG